MDGHTLQAEESKQGEITILEMNLAYSRCPRKSKVAKEGNEGIKVIRILSILVF
jgi:hypothetical protein